MIDGWALRRTLWWIHDGTLAVLAGAAAAMFTGLFGWRVLDVRLVPVIVGAAVAAVGLHRLRRERERRYGRFAAGPVTVGLWVLVAAAALFLAMLAVAISRFE